MTLDKAMLDGYRFRRTSWNWVGKQKYLFFDGISYRKVLGGRMVLLTADDLQATDWEISNPIRNKERKTRKTREKLLKSIEGLLCDP